MAFVERFVVSHDVIAQKPHVVQHALGQIDEFARGLGQVRRRDNAVYPRQLFSMCGVNRLDPGMGVRASENLAVEHAGQGDVGAIVGLTGHFVRAIVADGAFANYIVFLGR